MSITVKEEDGVTASFIRFDSLQLDHIAGGADVTFGIYNEIRTKLAILRFMFQARAARTD
jgi:hypothetical protein